MNHDLQQTLDDLLRRCVGCGLCLPHCATWAETGNEKHSPRGRLVLLADLLGDGLEDNGVRQGYAEAFDHCIGCRACESACPSGVPFELLEYGQQVLAESRTTGSGFTSLLIRHLDSPLLLGSLKNTGKMARGLAETLQGSHWRQKLEKRGSHPARLARLLGTLPQVPEKDTSLLALLDSLTGTRSEIISRPVTDEAGPEVFFFKGCANEGLLPDASRRLRQLLAAGGCQVKELAEQGCCGAIAAHSQRPGRAARQQREIQNDKNLLAGEGALVVEAAGCSSHLKESGAPLKQRVVDAGVLLQTLSWPKLRRIPLKVVYHDPCHALHAQGIWEEPRRLLDLIPGLIRVEAQEAEVCCGSGGTWGLNHPQLSQRLGRRKAQNLADTGADLVVTGNPGCMGQISDGLALVAPGLPILPLSDLLWLACFSNVVPLSLCPA